MLSILIPIYNFNVTSLVADLSTQCEAENINFEIILIDDGSGSDYKYVNNYCKEINNVTYIELESNIGRSKIRNKLASIAKYEYLLFIDCDSKVVDSLYINRYIENLKDNQVVCGGRAYEKNKPANNDYYLRWLYGIHRESFNADIRNLNSNNNFMTNNFIITKKVFHKIEFDENIVSYGHEDTLFGIELINNNIIIKHIDNPLIHVGLESAEEFIKKTKDGILNLIYILNYYSNTKQLVNSFKLLKWYQFLKNIFLTKLVVLFFKTFETRLVNNLTSKKPSLLILDIYKLGFLSLSEKIKVKSEK